MVKHILVKYEQKVDIQILVFGRLIIMQRLIDLLCEEGISVMSVSDGFADMIDLLEPEKIYLAIIDSHAEQAEVAYYQISKFGIIPIVFLIRDRSEDWKRMQWLDVYGFLPVQTGDRELAARLKTILRRRLTPKQAMKNNPRYAT